jgi:hypothetical protein
MDFYLNFGSLPSSNKITLHLSLLRGFLQLFGLNFIVCLVKDLFGLSKKRLISILFSLFLL